MSVTAGYRDLSSMTWTWSDIKPKIHDHVAVIICAVLGTLFVLIAMLWVRQVSLESHFDDLKTQLQQQFDAQKTLITKSDDDIKARIDQRLAGQDHQLERLLDRMDRWSMEFPVLARTELSQPVQLAVVTTTPKEVNGIWFRHVAVFDAAAGTTTTFLISLPSQQTDAALVTLHGYFTSLNEHPLTFQQVAKLSHVAGAPMTAPPDVDSENSYMFTMPVPNLSADLGAALHLQARRRADKLKFSDARDVFVALRRQPNLYAVANP